MNRPHLKETSRQCYLENQEIVSSGQTEKKTPEKNTRRRDEELRQQLVYTRKPSPDQDKVEEGYRRWPKLQKELRATLLTVVTIPIHLIRT